MAARPSTSGWACGAPAGAGLRAEGDRHLASVVAEMDVTELHARLIPEESSYGGAMLRRFDQYRTGLRELTELGNQARAIPERDDDGKAALETLTRYRELDRLDDVIADTAALLNLDRSWREAWSGRSAPSAPTWSRSSRC